MHAPNFADLRAEGWEKEGRLRSARVVYPAGQRAQNFAELWGGGTMQISQGFASEMQVQHMADDDEKKIGDAVLCRCHC